MSNRLDEIDSLINEAKKKRKKRKEKYAFAPFYGTKDGSSGATLPPFKAPIGNSGQSPSPASGAFPGPGGINSPSVPHTSPNFGTGPIMSSLEYEFDKEKKGVILNRKITTDQFFNTKKRMINSYLNAIPPKKTEFEIYVDPKGYNHVFSLKFGDFSWATRNIRDANEILYRGVFMDRNSAKNYISSVV